MLRFADAFTIANAALGFLAITYISDGKYLLAEVLLLLAVLADGLDGVVARRFGGAKEGMGDYLDIMADYLSFCVAPAILFYKLYFDIASTPLATRPEDVLVGVAAALLVICGLLRLARHVAKAGPAAGRFSGLPTTGAGLLVVLLVADNRLGDVVTSLLIAVIAALMVTEIPYPKVRGHPAWISGVSVVAAAAALWFLPVGGGARDGVVLAVLAGAAAYAFSGPAFLAARVPLGGSHVGKGAPHGTAEPPAGGGEVHAREAWAYDPVSGRPLTDEELATTKATAAKRKAELGQITRRLEEREVRLQKLKERIRSESGGAGAERDSYHERLLQREKELFERENALDQRAADLAGMEVYMAEQAANWGERRAALPSAEAKLAARKAPHQSKPARRADDTQEVDPDA